VTDVAVSANRLDTRIVLVTGASGAGRATAINVLEDFGFEAIGILPLPLLPRLLDGPTPLRPLAPGLDGRDPKLGAYIAADLLYDGFVRQITDLIELLLPAYRDQGKTHLSIGFGCTGGQHGSVAVTENLANTLAKGGWQVSKRHRELERRARSVSPLSVG